MNSDDQKREKRIASARAMRRDGDFAGAIKIMFDLCSKNMRDEEVVCELATMLADNEEFPRAQRLFQHALKISDDKTTLLINYGTFLCASGRMEEGIDVLERHREELIEAMKIAESIGCFDSAADYQNPIAYASLNLANARLERGRLDKGDYAKALELSEEYLTDADHWERADELVIEALEALDMNIDNYCRTRVHAKNASPMMIWHVANLIATETKDAMQCAKTLLSADSYLEAHLLRCIYHEDEFATNLASWIMKTLNLNRAKNAICKKLYSDLRWGLELSDEEKQLVLLLDNETPNQNKPAKADRENHDHPHPPE